MPVWHDIAADLREAIESGRYAPGDRLPTEDELAQQYGVVRNTVRRALEQMKTVGLITATPRRGTVVSTAPMRLTIARYATVVDPNRTRPDLGPWETACAEQGRAGHTEVVTVEHVPAPAEVAQRLEIAPDDMVVHRVRRMWADDTVEQLQDAWMPAGLVEGTPLADSAKVVGGVYAAMREAGFPAERAIEEVGLRLPTAYEAEELKLGSIWTTAIEQWRVTFGADDRPLEVMRAVTVRCVFTYDVPISNGR